MSDRVMKILVKVASIVFAMSAAMLQVPVMSAMPRLHQSLEIIISILGALGLGVLKPLANPGEPEAVVPPEPAKKPAAASKR